MAVDEITMEDLDAQNFIDDQIETLREQIGDEVAINALSGGVDSAVVTMLGHKAIGDQLKTYFIDNGLMRKNEPQQVVDWFSELDVPVEMVDAS